MDPGRFSISFAFAPAIGSFATVRIVSASDYDLLAEFV